MRFVIVAALLLAATAVAQGQGAGYGAPAYEPVPDAKETPSPPPSIEPIPFTPPPYEPVPIPAETSPPPPPPPPNEPVPFTPPPYEPVPISSKAPVAPSIPAETTAPPPPPPLEPVPFTPPPYEPVPISSKAPNASPAPAAETTAPPPPPIEPIPFTPPPYEPVPVAAGGAAPQGSGVQPNSVGSPPEDEIPVQHEQVTPPAPVVPSGCASDVLFVLDATGSVRKDYQNQKDFVKRIVETMNIAPSEQQVGMVLFSSAERQKIAFDLGTHEDKTSVLQAIDDLPYYSGITAIGQALVLAKQALEKRRPTVKVYVIVVTDGFSYDTVQGPAADLRAVPGVTVFSAGVAQPSNEFELKEIAGDESRVFIKQDSLQALVNAMACKIK